MKKFLVIMEVMDDGKTGKEDEQLDPVYLLKRGNVNKYIARHLDRDAGISVRFKYIEELIP